MTAVSFPRVPRVFLVKCSLTPKPIQIHFGGYGPYGLWRSDEMKHSLGPRNRYDPVYARSGTSEEDSPGFESFTQCA